MDYFKELEIFYKDEQHMDIDEEFVIYAGAQRILHNPDMSTGILTRYLDKNWKRISPTMQGKIGKLFQEVLVNEGKSGSEIDHLKINYLKNFLDTHEIPWPF